MLSIYKCSLKFLKGAKNQQLKTAKRGVLFVSLALGGGPLETNQTAKPILDPI
jgi:hypothetical protein